MSTSVDVAARGREQTAEVLTTLTNYRKVKDDAVAVALGIQRSAARKYRVGLLPLTVDRLYQLADFLDVEPGVFLMSPDEALRWVLEHRPNGARAIAEPTAALRRSSWYRGAQQEYRHTSTQLRQRPATGRPLKVVREQPERRESQRLLIDRSAPVRALGVAMVQEDRVA